MSKQQFGVDDVVEWSSVSGGVAKKKIGVVVQVVVAGAVPRIPFSVRPSARDHISFVVKADKGKLYWPRICFLKKVTSLTPTCKTCLGVVPELNEFKQVGVSTKIPEKWAMFDLETGAVLLRRDGKFRSATPTEKNIIRASI